MYSFTERIKEPGAQIQKKKKKLHHHKNGFRSTGFIYDASTDNLLVVDIAPDCSAYIHLCILADIG